MKSHLNNIGTLDVFARPLITINYMLTACFGNFFIFLLIHSKEDSRVNFILLLRHWFCSQVSIAVVNSMTKTNLGSKGRISAYSPSLKVVRGGTEGKAAY